PYRRSHPHRKAHSDTVPERAAQAACPPGRSEGNDRGNTTGKDFQQVGNERSRRGSRERRGLEKMQRHNDGGKDQGLPRHSWWYFRLSGWISCLTYFRGVGEPLHSRSTDVPCPTRGLQPARSDEHTSELQSR